MRIRILISLVSLLAVLRLSGQVADSSKTEEKFWIGKMDLLLPLPKNSSAPGIFIGAEFEKTNTKSAFHPSAAAYFGSIKADSSVFFIASAGLRYYFPVFRDKLREGEGLFLNAGLVLGVRYYTEDYFFYGYDYPEAYAVTAFRPSVGIQKAIKKWYFGVAYSYSIQPWATHFQYPAPGIFSGVSVLLGRRLN